MVRKNVLNGQVGLIMLVVMGVVVALIMSVASRSLSDTVISRQDRESSAAFAVAETGVESALNSLRSGTVPSGSIALQDSLNFATGHYAVTSNTSYGLFVPEGEEAQIDLTGFSGPITVSWTKNADASENPATCNDVSGGAPAALQFMAIRGTPPTVAFNYLNPYNCAVPGNSFAASSAGAGIYRSSLTYTPSAGTTILRLKPLYSGATIAVSGANLRTQLYLIQSEAAGGDAQKQIEVRRGLDAASSVFDFAIFSGGTITK